MFVFLTVLMVPKLEQAITGWDADCHYYSATDSGRELFRGNLIF
jgi:hypothetical protein